MKVFLSSTAVDLVAHRRVADDTILRLSQQAVVMERFGPLPGEPVAECERKAREADVLICLVAHRYGFEPEADKGSITRREVEAARGAGKKVLVWIVDDDHPWSERKEQDRLTDPSVLASPERVASVARSVQALQEFKSWLRATCVCDTFTTPDELGRKIAVALSNYAQGRVTVGLTPAVPARGEIRIVHALQPAPHFHGRDPLVGELSAWAADLASPDRVWSLVAPGGSGKTAVAERLVAAMEPGVANVLVWSFYESPDADAFLRECNHLFLGNEMEGPTGGRLERLLRGLRDGRPHLIVLDGLEMVQDDAGGGRVRGELSDHTLKLLLQALAGGQGRARALVTSRFPLVDLESWSRRGYRDTRLDDLSTDAAVTVLRSWGVEGTEAALAEAADQVGHHALSVAVIGSYLRSFAGGRVEAAADFDLNAVTGEDPRAAKLARVLAFYAQRLPEQEREVLARLSVFPRGVSLELFRTLADAGGEVAGILVKAAPRLLALLNSLQQRGLVFRYATPEAVTWTAHPFLRDFFRQLLGCRPEQLFSVVANALGAGLKKRPGTKPSVAAELDRYERLIETTWLADREWEAFDLYLHGLGGYSHLGKVLGEYWRGHRILIGFSESGQPEDLAPKLKLRDRFLLVNELGLYAWRLGRLKDARANLEFASGLGEALDISVDISIILQNRCLVALALGRLREAQAFASEAMKKAGDVLEGEHFRTSQSYNGYVAHVKGDVVAAQADFAATMRRGGEPLFSVAWELQTHHFLDLGDLPAVRTLLVHCKEQATINNRNNEVPRLHALFARLALAEGRDPSSDIEEIRAWTARTGDMEWIITAHLLAAQHGLALCDMQAALAEAETGLLHAETCGYGLLHIKLLVTMAHIRLAWPDPPAAIQAARHALDLATDPECGYAWGEADAAQAWGEAYFAYGELVMAQGAFRRAFAVRQRIRHPGVEETEKWLAHIS